MPHTTSGSGWEVVTGDLVRMSRAAGETSIGEASAAAATSGTSPTARIPDAERWRALSTSHHTITTITQPAARPTYRTTSACGCVSAREVATINSISTASEAAVVTARARLDAHNPLPASSHIRRRPAAAATHPATYPVS